MEGETRPLGHILSACEEHAFTLHKERYDRIFYQLVKEVANVNEVQLPKEWRAAVLGGRECSLLVDQRHPIIRWISANRPDLVVTKRKQQRVLIFEVTCCWDPNVGVREKEKRQKYLAPKISGASGRYGHQNRPSG